jgi:hypothetical protein
MPTLLNSRSRFLSSSQRSPTKDTFHIPSSRSSCIWLFHNLVCYSFDTTNHIAGKILRIFAPIGSSASSKLSVRSSPHVLLLCTPGFPSRFALFNQMHTPHPCSLMVVSPCLLGGLVDTILTAINLCTSTVTNFNIRVRIKQIHLISFLLLFLMLTTADGYLPCTQVRCQS